MWRKKRNSGLKENYENKSEFICIQGLQNTRLYSVIFAKVWLVWTVLVTYEYSKLCQWCFEEVFGTDTYVYRYRNWNVFLCMLRGVRIVGQNGEDIQLRGRPLARLTVELSALYFQQSVALPERWLSGVGTPSEHKNRLIWIAISDADEKVFSVFMGSFGSRVVALKLVVAHRWWTAHEKVEETN